MTSAQPSLCLIAGEASADSHGAELLRALQARHPHLKAFGIGGQAMRACGFEALIHAETMALAGLSEVLTALPRMLVYQYTIAREVNKRRPQVVVLMDLPDFNLPLAKRLKKKGHTVIYYISPQLWAWRPKRIKAIQRWVDRMLVILPFEKSFYAKHQVDVDFVGHPLVDKIPHPPNPAKARERLGVGSHPTLTLLPGSRRHEVKRHLPTMLQALTILRQERPQLQALIPVASTIDPATIEALIPRELSAHIRILKGQATDALAAADIAVVCSGTSTLQAALCQRPMVVIYRVSWLTYRILKHLVKISHIALVNLIANKSIVPELIQHRFTSHALADELQHLLENPGAHSQQRQALSEVRQQLGEHQASSQAATIIQTYFGAS